MRHSISISKAGKGKRTAPSSDFPLSFSPKQIAWQQTLGNQATLGKPGPGFPCWLSVKESTCQFRRHRFDPWGGKIPERGKWQPTPESCLGNPRGAWWATEEPGELLSMGFPSQQYCRGLPIPPPGDLADLGIKPTPSACISCIGRRILYHLSHLRSPCPWPKFCFRVCLTTRDSRKHLQLPAYKGQGQFL